MNDSIKIAYVCYSYVKFNFILSSIFTVEVPINISTSCEQGLRLNITVKDKLCEHNSTTKLCSGHGLCVSAPFQVGISLRSRSQVHAENTSLSPT